ncbi:MAG: hypothetical protein J5850_01060 [Clostridia bacterium]|nr:hypothetical protein [Clostridia bacterium]
MNKQDNITIAYRCPECGSGVMSIVGVFKLTGDMLKLKCDCGNSEMTMTYTTDKKIRLSVPCIVCNNPHNFIVNTDTVYNMENDVTKLSCKYTGIDLCFIGKDEKVREALQKADQDLAKLMEDAGINDLAELHSNDDEMKATDPEIDDIVRFMLAELSEEDKIHCRCRKKNLASYKYTIMNGYVRIYCEGCGSIADIPVTGGGSAFEFLSTDGLELE